jgi:hypothetical protein
MPIENVDVSTPASTVASGRRQVATIGASGQKYDSVTIHFSTQGTYTDFMALMKDLEQALRVVDLVNLSLTPGRFLLPRLGHLTTTYHCEPIGSSKMKI